MLSHPNGFHRSINSHNIDEATFLDWLEAGNLFADEELSQSDVVDYLMEEQLYDEQEFAAEFVIWAWSEIARRLAWLRNHSPIQFDDRRFIRHLAWTDVPAHSYCLVVSCGPLYDGWFDHFGSDYTEQGQLFELITQAAMMPRFKGWKFLHTGWRRNQATNLTSMAGEVSTLIGEPTGSLQSFPVSRSNDLGVDLVWYLPFPDLRGGLPVYLVQCASGWNWKSKLDEPNVETWRNIIQFPTAPNKAFALPFALLEKEVRWHTSTARGLLLDRYRLLAQNAPESRWVPASLRKRLIKWLEPRVDWIISRS